MDRKGVASINDEISRRKREKTEPERQMQQIL